MNDLLNSMVSKASELSVNQMKKWLVDNVNNYEIDVLVFRSVLDALEKKIGQDEYLKFADELYLMMGEE